MATTYATWWRRRWRAEIATGELPEPAPGDDAFATIDGLDSVRPTVATPEIIRAAQDMLPNPEHSVTSIAGLLGVSLGTLHNHIHELRERRAAGRAQQQLTGRNHQDHPQRRLHQHP